MIPSPWRLTLDLAARWWWRRARARARSGSEHSTWSTSDAPGQQLGDRSLADDVAPVHDGHGVTGALDFVEQVRGQHDRAALGHERQDHLSHVLHAGRVEPVHRLVQDEQLGVADQTGGHPEALAHPHGVLRHLVVGAVEDAHPFEGRPDAVAGRRLTGGGEDLEVLPPGQMAVEPRLVDDGSDPGQGLVAVPRELGIRAGTSCRRRRGSVRAALG